MRVMDAAQAACTWGHDRVLRLDNKGADRRSELRGEQMHFGRLSMECEDRGGHDCMLRPSYLTEGMLVIGKAPTSGPGIPGGSGWGSCLGLSRWNVNPGYSRDGEAKGLDAGIFHHGPGSPTSSQGCLWIAPSRPLDGLDTRGNSSQEHARNEASFEPKRGLIGT